MSTDAVESNENTPKEDPVDMRLEHAGSTPLPVEKIPEKEEPQNEPAEGASVDRQEQPADSKNPPPTEAPPSTVQNDENQQEGLCYPAQQQQQQHQPQQQQLPLSINQLAIVASAQNKLPVSKVKGIVMRLSRQHTESSGQKTAKWFKNENYVDKDNYSWKNMALFEDHQCHLWSPAGTVRSSYKK